MSTYGDAARLYLQVFGNPAPSADVMQWMCGWFAQEGTAAANNPVACTVSVNGSGFFNCLRGCPSQLPCSSCTFGVQNYNSLSDGALAAKENLMEPAWLTRYAPLLAALQTEDRAALGITNDQASAGVQGALQTWGGYGASAGSFYATGAAWVGKPYTATAGGGGSGSDITLGSGSTCDLSQYPCGCIGDANFSAPFSSACILCELSHPTDYQSVCVGPDVSAQTITDVITTSSKQAVKSALPASLNNAFSSGGNTIKFLLGLLLAGVGLGLVFEILTQQPVVSGSIRQVGKAVGFAQKVAA